MKTQINFPIHFINQKTTVYIEVFYKSVHGFGDTNNPYNCSNVFYADTLGCIITEYQDTVYRGLTQTNIFEASGGRQHKSK
jgi:hypothetical protein